MDFLKLIKPGNPEAICPTEARFSIILDGDGKTTEWPAYKVILLGTKKSVVIVLDLSSYYNLKGTERCFVKFSAQITRFDS